MTYKETIDWMFAQLPMYQQKGASALKHKLDNILNFSQHLDTPHTKFKSIHVAGTKAVYKVLARDKIKVSVILGPQVR